MASSLRHSVAGACAFSLVMAAGHIAFAQDDRPKAQPRAQAAPQQQRETSRRESAPQREAAPPREQAPQREQASRREAPPQRESAPRERAVTREAAPRENNASPARADEGSRRASAPREGSNERARGATTAPGANTASLEDQAVPRAGSRPRDGRPATSRAVPRTNDGPRTSRSTIIYYPRRDYPFGYGGYGLGYFYYDPYSWGSSYPGYYGGYGYGYPGYSSGYGYGGGYGGGYVYATGAIRLKVKPRDAEVYVDGYYVGRVDDFDGVFQRLTLEAGVHRIEIREPGLQPRSFEVRIRPGETITYDADLRKLP